MPHVGIIMGSDSDLAIMNEACDILEQFQVEYDVTVCSAHRLPHETAAYASGAEGRESMSLLPEPGEQPTCRG